MEDIKVSFSVEIPGRVRYTEEYAEANPECYDVHHMRVESKTKVNHKWVKDIDVIHFRTRKGKPIRQSINFGSEAYKAMISNTSPEWWKKANGNWGRMNKEQRIEAQLNRYAEYLGGTLLEFTVFED